MSTSPLLCIASYSGCDVEEIPAEGDAPRRGQHQPTWGKVAKKTKKKTIHTNIAVEMVKDWEWTVWCVSLLCSAFCCILADSWEWPFADIWCVILWWSPRQSFQSAFSMGKCLWLLCSVAERKQKIEEELRGVLLYWSHSKNRSFTVWNNDGINCSLLQIGRSSCCVLLRACLLKKLKF